VAVPYALQRRALFFGAFTGTHLLRNDPPDRYVFNYRASSAEEIHAIVQYLLKSRRMQPKHIAVFSAQDAYGDDDFAAVTKAIRVLGMQESGVLRLSYNRNSLNVDDAVSRLSPPPPSSSTKQPAKQIKAVILFAPFRIAARFIEKARGANPGTIFANLSSVGSTKLADELVLLGPRYTSDVIVTQVVPPVSGYSSVVLEYKKALAKYFPGEKPGYVSLEAYIGATLLVQALKRADPPPLLDTENLVDTLENMRALDLGLGTELNFGRTEHQASHKVWGSTLDQQGQYQSLDLQ
jgi:ABC-type branched-subunit amino acid transport system substrate-binding protein